MNKGHKMPRKPAAAEEKPLSKRVLVLIKREQTTATPRVVWRHERPILEAIFGDGNAEEIDPETMNEGYTPKASPQLLIHNKKQDIAAKPSEAAGVGYVFIGDPRAEYERLVAAYGMHPEIKESFAEHVFGRFQSGMFATIVGSPTLEDLPEQQLRDLISAYGYTMPEATYQSDDDERKQATQARAHFLALSHAELVKTAQEYGVEVGA